MEPNVPVRRKRPKKSKVENYYKILGVRANASAETIKKSYIQLVKQNPPESHPEQFQQIRKAYETLRDPAKRKEYDFQRKYGGSLTSIMDEAFERMEQENYDKAEALFRQALKISAETISARIGLAHIMLIKDEFKLFEEQSELLIEAGKSDEDKQRAHALIAKMLLDYDYPEQALERMQLLLQQFPEAAAEYLSLLTAIYRDLGREEDAFKLIESRIPSVEDQHPDQFGLFIDWINVMIQLEKWQYWSKVQPRMKKFLKSIDDEDDKEIIISALLDEYLEYTKSMMYREAELFADLAYFLDKNHEAAQKARADAQQHTRLWKEISSMPGDKHLSPLTSIKAAELFYVEFGQEAGYSGMADQMLSQLMDEFGEMQPDLAAELRRMRMKYPLFYNRFRGKLEAFYEENSSVSEKTKKAMY